MLKLILCTLLLALALVSESFAQQPMQDVIYLTNGSIIRGQIVEQVPNVSLKIQTRDGSVLVYQMTDIQRMTKEPLAPGQAGLLKAKKSPGLAFFLSAMLPGVGQYYNGEPIKGVIHNVLFVGGFILFTVGATEFDDTLEATGGILFTGTWIWSMIDAPLSASRINAQAARGYGHLLEWNRPSFALGFDPAPRRDAMNAKLTLHF